MNKRMLIILAAGLVIGAAIGYYFGYDHGFERAASLIKQ